MSEQSIRDGWEPIGNAAKRLLDETFHPTPKGMEDAIPWETADAFEREVLRDIWSLLKQSKEAKRRRKELIDYLRGPLARPGRHLATDAAP
jgi:hypothetical protein